MEKNYFNLLNSECLRKYEELTVYPRYIRVLILFNLNTNGMKLKKLIPKPENVFFLYTDVSNLLFILVTKQSKIGRV